MRSNARAVRVKIVRAGRHMSSLRAGRTRDRLTRRSGIESTHRRRGQAERCVCNRSVGKVGTPRCALVQSSYKPDCFRPYWMHTGLITAVLTLVVAPPVIVAELVIHSLQAQTFAPAGTLPGNTVMLRCPVPPAPIDPFAQLTRLPLDTHVNPPSAETD